MQRRHAVATSTCPPLPKTPSVLQPEVCSRHDDTYSKQCKHTGTVASNASQFHHPDMWPLTTNTPNCLQPARLDIRLSHSGTRNPLHDSVTTRHPFDFTSLNLGNTSLTTHKQRQEQQSLCNGGLHPGGQGAHTGSPQQAAGLLLPSTGSTTSLSPVPPECPSGKQPVHKKEFHPHVLIPKVPRRNRHEPASHTSHPKTRPLPTSSCILCVYSLSTVDCVSRITLL